MMSEAPDLSQGVIFAQGGAIIGMERRRTAGLYTWRLKQISKVGHLRGLSRSLTKNIICCISSWAAQTS